MTDWQYQLWYSTRTHYSTDIMFCASGIFNSVHQSPFLKGRPCSPDQRYQAAAVAAASVGSAPAVISQPKPSIEAFVGQRMKLVVSVQGTPPITFKWYKDTRELVFAQGNVLELPSVSFSDRGRYCCAISNAFGSILSDNFIVNVKKIVPPSGEILCSLIILR